MQGRSDLWVRRSVSQLLGVVIRAGHKIVERGAIQERLADSIFYLRRCTLEFYGLFSQLFQLRCRLKAETGGLAQAVQQR